MGEDQLRQRLNAMVDRDPPVDVDRDWADIVRRATGEPAGTAAAPPPARRRRLVVGIAAAAAVCAAAVAVPLSLVGSGAAPSPPPPAASPAAAQRSFVPDIGCNLCLGGAPSVWW